MYDCFSQPNKPNQPKELPTVHTIDCVMSNEILSLKEENKPQAKRKIMSKLPTYRIFNQITMMVV